MRHGRAKAARKTLQHFQRTVNLKSRPYYSVLLDATFLIAMIRITANNTGNEEGVESTIVSRIERVLQVNNNHTSGAPFSGRDERLSGVVDDYNNNSNNNNRNWNESSQQSSNNHNINNSGSGQRFERFKVRYYVPQEAIDEIETILKTFQERSENTKKQKKKKEYETKSKVFREALTWIKKNSARKHSHRGSGRCEVLPKLAPSVEPPSKKKKKQGTESDKANKSDDDDDDEPVIIGASDAVRRHIARDDGREDPETNKIISKKEQTNESFSRTYICASQEEDLLDDLRMLGTVPILRCANNASVLILENPSKKGQRTDAAKEHTKWKGALQNSAERALVDAAWEAQKKEKIKIMGVDANMERQKSKAKGPNPLSCKRKRVTKQQQGSGESKSKKRRARAKRNKESSGETTNAKE